MDLELTGQVILVTGGVRGVGAGISAVLTSLGATVVTCARRVPETGEPGTGESQPYADFFSCDIRDPEAVTAMLASIVTKYGRLDAVVNNAGGAPYALAAEASPNFHKKIIELNLLAPLLVAQLANSIMQQQDSGGTIINISSISGTRPSPGTAAYGAAKAGLDSLTQSLAVEWSPKVRVNSVVVGPVETEQAALHIGDAAAIAAVGETIPLGRMALPDDVGGAVAFLISDLASFISGSTLTVHGGGERPAFLAAANVNKK